MSGSLKNIGIEFLLSAAENRWFKYCSESKEDGGEENDIFHSFWPDDEHPSLNESIFDLSRKSGIYCIAWGKPHGVPKPSAPKVQYIGQTINFGRRIREFAYSAGVYFDFDERYSGHSAGWRWGYAKSKEKNVSGFYGEEGWEEMYMAFFPVPNLVDEYPEAHLQEGILTMYEAQAIHSYYTANGEKTPPVNKKNRVS